MTVLRNTKSRRPAVLLQCVVMLLVLLNSGRTSAQTYTFSDLHTLSLPDGYTDLSIDVGTQPIQVDGALVRRASVAGAVHGMLWNAAGTPIDLNPVGYSTSQISGIRGGQQVGIGTTTPAGHAHALLWTGGSNTAIDLTPPGFEVTASTHTSGAQQVGWGFSTTLGYRPLFWNGTNAAVDLQPPNFDNNCVALGTDGTQQVGYGHGTITGNQVHALLWNGTNAATDLNPAGFTESWRCDVRAGLRQTPTWPRSQQIPRCNEAVSE